MEIHFCMNPVIIIVATIIILISYNGNEVVLCQTPEEMRDFVLKANRGEQYWPNLVCVPHGWSENFTVELQQAKTSQELVDAGVASLYKLEKITQKCKELVNKNKDKIGKRFKVDCSRSCILRELGILKNSWSQNVSLGDGVRAAAQIKQLLTAKLYPNRVNLSAELSSEIVVQYIQFHMKNSWYFRRELLCFTGTATDHNYISDYTVFLGESIYEWMEGCRRDTDLPTKFPSKWDRHGGWRHISKREMHTLKKGWKGWPDANCLNNRYESTMEDDDWRRWRLYGFNMDCRDQYNFNQMNKEFGEQASETCIKVCILEKLQTVGFVNEEKGSHIFDKIGMKQVNESFRKENTNMTVVLLPNWIDTPGENELEKYGKMFYDGVTKSLTDHGIAPGAECYRTNLWNPVFRDVDEILNKACNKE